MEQPPKLVAWGSHGFVCRLHKALHGLKQSPRAWFGRLSTVLQEFGMTRGEAGHSAFCKHSSTN